MTGVPVHGVVEPAFEAVRDAFASVFDRDAGELGAAACAYLDGRKVIDLWGGYVDADRTREWRSDTLAVTYSATKGMTTTCAHRLVERGLLDLDEPVATYWPEFAEGGKGDLTVRMVLTHQAGLVSPTVRVAPEERFDWEVMTSALARSTPAWEPGTRTDYHGGTFGYLVGELVRRVDGRPHDVYFREEIAEPLGADVHQRVDERDEHRCAEIVGDGDAPNTRDFRVARDGSATGHGTADGLARVYGALARGGELDGVQVLRPETIEAATEDQPLVRTREPGSDFALGFQQLWKQFPFGPFRPFGHTGMGGTIGLADPGLKLGFGYVLNRLHGGGATTLLPVVYGATIEALRQ